MGKVDIASWVGKVRLCVCQGVGLCMGDKMCMLCVFVSYLSVWYVCVGAIGDCWMIVR